LYYSKSYAIMNIQLQKEKPMQYNISDRLMKDQQLTASDKLVYMVIKHTVENVSCSITSKLISEIAGLTEMTVRRSVKRLQDKQEILMYKNTSGNNCYDIISKD